MDKPGNPVGWFEIYVSDMARARTFYTAVFGRELTSLPEIGEGGEMYAFPWVEGAAGAAGALVKHPMACSGKGGDDGVFLLRRCQQRSGSGGRSRWQDHAAEDGDRAVRPYCAGRRHRGQPDRPAFHAVVAVPGRLTGPDRAACRSRSEPGASVARRPCHPGPLSSGVVCVYRVSDRQGRNDRFSSATPACPRNFRGRYTRLGLARAPRHGRGSGF